MSGVFTVVGCGAGVECVFGVVLVDVGVESFVFELVPLSFRGWGSLFVELPVGGGLVELQGLVDEVFLEELVELNARRVRLGLDGGVW